MIRLFFFNVTDEKARAGYVRAEDICLVVETAEGRTQITLDSDDTGAVYHVKETVEEVYRLIESELKAKD